MQYLFIDTTINKVYRVTASSLDAAWRRYIEVVYGDLKTLKAKHDLTVPEARERLSHDVFVYCESEVEVL